MKIEQLLAIVILLLNKERIPAKDLAQRFGVSVRTIYRDLETINLAGIPIVSYPGSNGGFGIVENYKINHQMLSFNEIIAILSALKGLNSALNDQEIDLAIEKVSNLIPADKEPFIFEQIIFDILPWGYVKHQIAKIKQLHTAITKNLLITIKYIDRNSIPSSRIVEPMSLVYKGFSWYLFVYCQTKSDYRLFRLSRIKEFQILTETFKRRTYNYYDYLKRFQSTSDLIKLTLKFSPNATVVVEDFFNAQEITPLDTGELLVQTTFYNDAWLYSTLLSYGAEVKVVDPTEVRDKLKQIAQQIIDSYK
jgi:predicted DNA-binding transcriptional regulator YafY